MFCLTSSSCTIAYCVRYLTIRGNHHCYIERNPVREKQQNHDNKATRCVICRIDWILLTVKKNSLNTKRVRGILMLQSLSFLVISVMFYCSLSFCKIVPQTLYQRLYQNHVTFTPDPLSGNTKLGRVLQFCSGFPL